MSLNPNRFTQKLLHILPTGMTFILILVIALSVMSTRSSADEASALAQEEAVAQTGSSSLSPALLPPVFSVTKRDTLLVDNDSDTQADPGDTIGYTVAITNTGPDPATGTVFTDTIDSRTTLVAGTVETTPLARGNSYVALGNVRISHLAAAGLLANDNDPDGGTVTVTAFDAVSAQGGVVAVNADGSFSYNPPAGYEGVDTFNYTITDDEGDTNSDTVTITISGMIWFIDNNAAACTAAGCGRLTNPFSTLAAFNALNNGTGNNPASGDNIFIYESGTGYGGAVTLLTGQKLIGQDATATLATITGLTPPAGSDAFPAMNSGNGTETSLTTTVTLNTNVTVRGLRIDSTTSTGMTDPVAAITGVSVSEVKVTTTTGTGVDFSGTAGTLNFIQLTTSGGRGANLVGNTGGTFTFSTVSVSSGANTAFNATGGGTVNVCDENPCNPGATGGLVNTLTTTTGTALNIANTNIGVNNLEFQSISVNGAAKGIILNTTGASGGLRVTGVGATNGSGGIIQNISTRGAEFISTNNLSLRNMTFTNACTTDFPAAPTGLSLGNNTADNAVIHLQNVNGAALDNVDITGSAEQGINGHNVSNFSYNNSTMLNVGNGPDEDGIHFYNMVGTSTINNSTITSSGDDNVNIQNNNNLPADLPPSTIGTITINGGSTNTGVLGSGYLFGIRGTMNTTIDILNVTSNNNFSGGVVADSFDTATMDIEVSNSTITNNNDGVSISSNNGNSQFYIHDNLSFAGTDFVRINVLKAAFSTGGTFQGTISNNPIVVTDGQTTDGVAVQNLGGGTLIASIINNTFDYRGTQRALYIAAGQDGNATVQATVTGNNFDIKLDGTGNAVNGILAQAAVASPSGDPTTMCIDIGGAGGLSNLFTHSLGGAMAGGDIRVRQRFISNFRMPGYAGGPADTAAAAAYLDGRNTEVSASTVTIATAITGGGPCTQPSLVMSPESNGFAQTQPGSDGQTGITGQNDANSPAAAPLPITENNIIPREYLDVAPLSTPNTAPTESEGLDMPNAAPMLSGENINIVIGVLPPGKSITVWFNVTVDDPFPAGPAQVCNQSTVLSNELPPVVSNDPDTGAANDPTCTPIDLEADLSITKTDGVATTVPGTPIIYTITAANAGPQPDPTALVVDTFPATITGVTWTCVGAGGATCPAAGAGNINTTVNLPVGGSVTFTASGTISAAATGSLVNTATITPTIGLTDPVPANNSATDTNTLTPQADVSITKTDGQATDIPGTSIVYTIVASNSGPSNAPGTTIADTFPATLTGVTWTCVGAGGGTCTAAGAGNINDTANLPAGGSVTYTVNATIAASATGILSNTATATVAGGVTDPTPANNSATDTTTLTPQADVSITKTDGQVTDVPGTSIVYTIVAANVGPSNAPTVTVADTFPAALTGVTWTCVGAGGGTCTAAGAGNINDAVNLPAGGSVTYTVNATIDANASGTLSNTATATVGGGVTDPVPANNSATDNTTLTPQADLSITKTDGTATEIPGTSATYTIVASNSGPSNDPAATVVDTFPAILTGVTWTCAGAGGATCTAAGTGNINDTVNLPAGGSVTYTAVGTIDAAATGTLVNTATVTSSITDPAPANNSATDTDTLTPQVDVSITKTDGQATAVPGTPIVYTIVASNSGPSNAPGTAIADTFPATLTGVAWTCVGAGGGTCTAAGAGNLNDTANLPVGSSVTYTVNATISGSASGTLSNTATATVGGGITDTAPGNNSATDTTTLTPQADLSITKTDGQTTSVAGAPITYTIVASNAGPSTVTGATVADTFPASLTGMTWTCSGSGGGTCAAAGAGNINDTVNLPAGASVTYIAVGTIDVGATGSIVNTATITAPGGVTDPVPSNNSATDTTSLDAPPVITNLTVTPGTINENGSVTVDVTFTDPNTPETHEVVIDWGDGITTTINLPIGVLTTSANHQYLDDNPTATPSDVTTITVTVNEPDGGTDTDTTTVTINNVAPVLSAVNATNVNENGTTTLTGTITDPGTQDTFTLTVDWGDGSAPQVFNYGTGTANFSETHQYLDDNPTGTPSDNYTVSLTLTDDDTGSDTDSDTITVSNVAPALSGVAATNVNENGTTTLSGTITDPGTLDTFTLVVDWGDGSAPQTFNYAAGTTSFNETHQYLDDNPTGTPSDNVTVSLTLTDDDTGSDTDSATVTVSNVAPTLSAVAAANVNENGVTTLTGTITDPGTLDTFSLVVNWGDGSAPQTFNYAAGTTGFSETHTYLDDNPTGTPVDNVTINLTLTDDDTGSDTDSDTITVTNIAPTLSGVTATALVNEGDVATLAGTITDPGTLDTFALVVDWGDGSAPQTFNYVAGTTSFSETHTYQDDNPTGTPSDNVTINLTLTDDDTGSDTDSAAITVNNVAPALSAVAATNVNENGSTTLSGTITDPGTLDTFSLVVDWGDGSAPETFNYGVGTTNFSESHQYLDDNPTGTPSDSYTISLTLTDDDTGSDTDSTTLTVSNVAPALGSLVISSPINEDDTATLTGTITDPGTLDTFSLVVNWGDGSAPQTFNYVAGTTSFTATHQFLDDNPTVTPSDQYTMTLTLTDDDTGADSDNVALTVNNVAPALNNVTATAVITETEVVTLTGFIAEVGTQDTFTLTVDWADGITETFSYPAGTTAFVETHQYLDDGLLRQLLLANFDLDLTLSDDDSGVVTQTVTVVVNNQAPTLSNVVFPSGVDEGDTATLTGNINEISPLDTFTLAVDWGDGITETFNYAAATTAFTETHIYQDDNPTATPSDTYTVTLILSDDNGGTDVMTTTVTVDNVAPVLNSLAVTSVDENDAAALTANLVDPGVLDTFAIVVDWGDGITETFNYGAGATTISETHVYLDDNPTGTPADPYTVTVSITDDDTGTDTGAAALIVSNVAPTVNAGADQTVTFATPVNFAGSFTDPGTLDTHEVSWDMGDGTIITGTLTPSHLYQTAGAFTVTLTVTDDDTGVGTDTMQVMVGTPTDVTLTSFAGQSRSWIWVLIAAALLPLLIWWLKRTWLVRQK